MSRRKGFTRQRQAFTRQREAFTLVELLVVIGIIAILISVLLPTLSSARRSAQTLACASNVRQLALAIRLFSQEHRGYMPSASDEAIAKQRDPSRSIFVWRRSSTDPEPVMLDWASSLLPYLGVKNVEWFAYAPDNVSKIFKCPSDRWLDVSGSFGTAPMVGGQINGPGYLLWNNVYPNEGGYPISYAINGDIACSVTTSVPPDGRFAEFESINCFGGPNSPIALPLSAKFDRVKKPAEVLLVADCGSRPNTGLPNPSFMRSDVQIYTSHNHGIPAALATLGNDRGKLSGVSKYAVQGKRIPWDRHKNKINVAFVDGHGETIQKGTDESKVRISPYNW